MKRRDFLGRSAALSALSASPALGAIAAEAPAAGRNPLTPPPHGRIPAAFLLSEGAVIIDFCGPWEVFQDVNVPGRDEAPFELYTVAETDEPLRASGGLRIVPDYTFQNAPAPKVIVIPAQSGRTPATLEWVRRSAKNADVTLSVCTGAFLLASTGLLAGKGATTHHAFYRVFARQFPGVELKRGARFVEAGNLASAGGLSSGIDLALHVVERYFGREIAKETAFQMEYQGQGWMNPDSNAAYAVERASTEAHPLCPVCDMAVDPATSPKSSYGGRPYYFCSIAHKQTFDAAPASWLEERP